MGCARGGSRSSSTLRPDFPPGPVPKASRLPGEGPGALAPGPDAEPCLAAQAALAEAGASAQKAEPLLSAAVPRLCKQESLWGISITRACPWAAES